MCCGSHDLVAFFTWLKGLHHARTPLNKMAAISLNLRRELKSAEVCPFLSVPPSYSGQEPAMSKAGCCCLCFAGGVKPCPRRRWLLLCGVVRGGRATAPQSDSHLVGGHGFTTEQQPSCRGTQLHSPCTAHSTGAIRSCAHPR